jgi:two-component system cell cycle response regulator
MMPELDGFEVCRRLKADPATHHIPVVMVTALDQPSDRVRGLEAGADDFLTKPVSDIALVARVRSLVRLKMVTDELRMRAATSQEIGIGDPVGAALADSGRGGRVLVVDDRAASYQRLAATLSEEHSVDIESDPQQALFHAAEGDYDLIMVSLGLERFDGLRLCSQIRSLDRTGAFRSWSSPKWRIARACCAAWRSGSTIIWCVRSTATKCWPASARRCARSATAPACATMCNCRSRWRSPMR